jgi:succinate dehydrogenase / fumarate reductase iron-sulfur subunit
MLINNKPRLACSTFLDEFKGKTITLEPFSKFPLVKDLITDKTTMFESLKTLETFLKSEAYQSTTTHTLRYTSAKCIMCGCCLEVCPNFSTSDKFMGAVGAVNAFRILDNEQSIEHRAVVSKRYTERFFNGCGKSLACQNVCPVGIPIDELTARCNAVAIWKRS